MANSDDTTAESEELDIRLTLTREDLDNAMVDILVSTTPSPDGKLKRAKVKQLTPSSFHFRVPNCHGATRNIQICGAMMDLSCHQTLNRCWMVLTRTQGREYRFRTPIDLRPGELKLFVDDEEFRPLPVPWGNTSPEESLKKSNEDRTEKSSETKHTPNTKDVHEQLSHHLQVVQACFMPQHDSQSVIDSRCKKEDEHHGKKPSSALTIKRLPVHRNCYQQGSGQTKHDKIGNVSQGNTAITVMPDRTLAQSYEYFMQFRFATVPISNLPIGVISDRSEDKKTQLSLSGNGITTETSSPVSSPDCSTSSPLQENEKTSVSSSVAHHKLKKKELPR